MYSKFYLIIFKTIAYELLFILEHLKIDFNTT
jgi:hypothetical protein